MPHGFKSQVSGFIPLKIWLPIAVFAVLWLDLIRQLSYVWETNEQYAYGWFVPLLALGLFLKKWPTRPMTTDQGPRTTGDGPRTTDYGPRTTDHGLRTTDPVSVAGSQSSVVSSLPGEVSSQWSVVSGLVFLLCLFLLPLRMVHEINQDWPLISWAYALVVVALTLYALHLAGPPSVVSGPPPVVPGPRSTVHGLWSLVHRPWSFLRSPWSVVRSPWSSLSPWVKYFAFPVCFILVAVQWPYRIENPLTKALMRTATSITVELLGWLDIPAVQRGNLIELATGTVGVDEACSGIRSFQSSLMAALFLGELYLFRWRIRFLLVGVGLFVAFLLNICRTLLLSYQASSSGLQALEKWHDPAGLTIAIACFLVLWAIAVVVKKRTTDEGPRTTDHGLLTTDQGPETKDQGLATTDYGPRTTDHGPRTTDPVSVVSSQWSVVSSPWSVVRSPWSVVSKYLLAVGLWSLLCILATEAWYRSHDIGRADPARWWANLPTNSPAFSPVPISAFARKLLKYDEGASASWRESDGSAWQATCLRWRAGDPTARMSALAHRPEYCMTGGGHQMNADLGTKYILASGLNLPFRTYIFDAPAHPLYVFFCLWEDGSEKQSGFAKTKYHDRLRGALQGRRGLGQQTLELICSGYQSLAEAEAAVSARLPEIIKIERSDH